MKHLHCIFFFFLTSSFFSIIATESDSYCAKTFSTCYASPLEKTFVKAIHEDDHLFRLILNFTSFEDSLSTYYQNGYQSAQQIASIIENLGINKDVNNSFLEFASGYGMVTRHLINEIAPMRIVACDIHPKAVQFIKEHIGVEAIGSHYVPEYLNLNESFDIVFALSFFSHMPHKSFGRWLKALYNAVKPGGYLIFTTHGRTTAKNVNLTIPANGILFSPLSEQADLDKREYGGTLVSPEYVVEQVTNYLDNSLHFFAEAVWWGHQDLYIVRKPN